MKHVKYVMVKYFSITHHNKVYSSFIPKQMPTEFNREQQWRWRRLAGLFLIVTPTIILSSSPELFKKFAWPAIIRDNDKIDQSFGFLDPQSDFISQWSQFQSFVSTFTLVKWISTDSLHHLL